MLVGESFFIYLFPSFNWEIAHKIQTLTFYLGAPLIVMFFMSIFPKYLHIHITRLIQIVGAAYACLVIFAPAKIFTSLNFSYQLFAILIIVYLLYVFSKIYLGKEKGIWLILVGSLALFITVINDIIFVSVWMNDNGPLFLRTWIRTDNLASYGQLIFAFTNSLVLARRFSNSLEKEERMTMKLAEMNLNLDKLVKQRTNDLEQSKEKIESQKIELEKTNKSLHQLSMKDSLTGAWNRRKYDSTIQSRWNQCSKHRKPLALLLLDIDYYKQFNDLYGHMAGDECLIKIAETINHSLQQADHLVARYGGEEFVVILPGLGKVDALQTANMLRQNIQGLQIPHSQSIVDPYVTVSVGVTSLIPDHNSSPDMLFRTVDKALYLAKDLGRNRVQYLSE